MTTARPRAPHHCPRSRFVAASTALGLVMTTLSWLVLTPPGRAAEPQTVISMTFDDGYAGQLPAAAALTSHGMAGTFYVNSGTIGLDKIMTRDDLDSLAAAGHEIGGHTVNHPSLPSLPSAEAKRQICLDRNNLIDWGFSPRSFAYPFAATTEAVNALVQQCGYNSGRQLGDLKSRFGGQDGLYAETVPPPDPYETRALDQFDQTWTLQDLKDSVTNAEDHGGGWVQLTFHDVCTTSCTELSLPQDLFEEFLTWLAPRAGTHGTVVKTVGDVVGGTVKPRVTVPDPTPPTDASGLTNPGFETLTPSGTPECWMKGGYGTNTALFDTVSPGRTGTRAGRLTVTDYADGDAKLLAALDLGTCAPAAASGQAYHLNAWYTSTANTQYDVFLRTASGSWIYWDSSPYFGPSSTWSLATWTTGVVPDGYTGISFGLNLFSNGVLTVDDYGITVGTATAPTTTATVSPEAPTATGWYVTRPTVTLTRTAAAGWTIQYSLDGTTWLPYTAPFPVPNGTTTLSYRAKGAGDYAETTRTLTLKVDTDAPTVTTSFDKPTRTLTATAADTPPGSGVDTIETSTDGTTWTPYTGPVPVPDSSTRTTYSVRATDVAGNLSVTETRSVAPALETTASVSPSTPDGTSGWYRTSPSVTVSTGPSTPSAEFSYDGSTWTAYTTPVEVPDGQNTISYRGVSGEDRGDLHEIDLKVDTQEPTVTPVFDQATRTLSATATDATSGVERIESSSDGGTTWTTHTEDVTLSDSAATFRFRAVDRAGNTSATSTVTVKDRQGTPSVRLTLASSTRTFGRATTARVVVTADADSPRPTGSVTFIVDGRAVKRVALTGGAAAATLPPSLRAGRHTVSAIYSGDAQTRAGASNRLRLTVQKARPTVSAKLRSSRIVAGTRPQATATVRVPGTSVRATGRVVVRVDGKVVARATLRSSDRGRLTIRLPRMSREGSFRVKVAFLGSSDITGRTSSARTLRVR